MMIFMIGSFPQFKRSEGAKLCRLSATICREKTARPELLGNSQERGIVAKRVGMDGMPEARTPSGSLAGMARCFLVDWVIGSMPTVAGKEPIDGFLPQPAPVLA